MERNSGETHRLEIPEDRPSALYLAVDDLIGCLTQGSKPASTGEDALAALEVIVGFHISHRNQGKLTLLPLEGADRQFEVLIG